MVRMDFEEIDQVARIKIHHSSVLHHEVIPLNICLISLHDINSLNQILTVLQFRFSD